MALTQEWFEFDIHPHVIDEYDFQVSQIKWYGSVAKIETQLGVFAVKKANMSGSQAIRMNEILQFLQEHRWNTSTIVSNKFAEPFVPVKNGIVYVTKWVEGEHLTLNHRPHFLVMVKVMAHLHKLGFEYNPEPFSYHFVDETYLRNSWEERLKWLKKYQKKLTRKESLTTFEHVILSYLPFLKEWSEEALEHLTQWVIQYNSIGDLRKTICHGKFHHRNMLLKPNGKMVLIDFDHVSLDTPVRDLANFIRKYILNKEHRFWAQEWFDRYQKIVSLTEPEKKLLAIYLIFPERIFTLAKKYEEKQQYGLEEQYLKKLQIRWGQMKEIIWFIDQQFI
ncbi:MAG: phosphotransferase [Tepidibacillus sp.]